VTEEHRPQILGVLLTFAGVALLAVWVGGMTTNRDALWFVSSFDARPQLICIYHSGTVTALAPGQAEFDVLVAAMNAEIPQHQGFADSLTPAGTSLDSYVLRGYAVEARYAAPVQVHTRFLFGAAPRLLFALDGSYNYIDNRMLFRGGPQGWLPGGLILKSIDRTRAAADAALATTGTDPGLCR
jgi:hypothetical protein